jgi:hypothetical protein
MLFIPMTIPIKTIDCALLNIRNSYQSPTLATEGHDRYI